MKLYFEVLKMHIKSILEYKKSFIIGFISQFFVFFTYYFIILALFSRFNNIKGFNVYEVLLCFSIIQMGYTINQVFARGIDKFDTLIINGNFDRLLLRPRNLLLQSIMWDIDFVKISRIFQSIIILFIALYKLNISFDIYKIITLILMILSSIVIFFSLFLFMASYCFYTVQGLEIRNLFTDGSKHLAQYPIVIFKKEIMTFFTIIIPFGFVNYYPLLYLLGKTNNILYVFSPLIVFIYVIPSLLLFKFGIKKYTSVGS